MERRKALEDIGVKHGLLAVYLFGSRADDGLRLLRGESVNPEGSDLDIGIVFREREPRLSLLGSIQVELSDVFSPLTTDVVPLQNVDPLFQFRAIDGHRVVAANTHKTDLFELDLMRQAAELLPVQRQLERDLFGESTS